MFRCMELVKNCHCLKNCVKCIGEVDAWPVYALRQVRDNGVFGNTFVSGNNF